LTSAAATATIPSDGIPFRDIAATIPSGDPVSNDPAGGPAPLSPQVFQILLSLVDSDLHGYAIIQDVAARTKGEIRLTASTLYAAVKRLLDSGWIEEPADRPRGAADDPRRRYYRLTALGRDAARAEARRLERLAGMARGKRLLPPLRASSSPKGSS
jgi:DNA-binding PadR family transcriptional regulator